MAGSRSSSMRGGRSRRAMSDINVVPYIDVMLVLLVIFMVTAPLVAPSIVNLPTVGGAAKKERPVLEEPGVESGLSCRRREGIESGTVCSGRTTRPRERAKYATTNQKSQG